jgi:hypothetical protein
MTGALVTVRGALRLPSLRRLIPAFLAFSITEWASWIGIVVFAYARGGAVEAGVVAGVVFIPSIIVAPAASMFGDRWPRARVLTGAYGILAASMAATAVALVLAPPIIAYAVATLLPEVAQTPDELAVANAGSTRTSRQRQAPSDRKARAPTEQRRRGATRRLSPLKVTPRSRGRCGRTGATTRPRAAPTR